MKNDEYESILVCDDDDDEQEDILNFPNKNIEYGNNNSTFLDNNIAMIFNNNLKERVLCIGEVQSGKTANIIKVIDRAFELNYDGVIFFAGINNILKNQSKNRVSSSFLKNQEISVIDSYETSFINSYLELNKKFVLNILKESKNLENIFNKLNSLMLKGKKILIIDDECDYGSINTGIKNTPKLFHEKIEKLFLRIHEGKLLQVTATPFANILTSKNFAENKEFKHLNQNPTKVVVLDRYSDYCGLKVFNKFNPYIVVKGDDDIKEIHNSIIIFILKTIDIKYDDEQKNKKTQLLFNISLNTENHDDVFNKITKYISRLSKASDFEIKREISYVFQDFRTLDLNNGKDLEFYSKELKIIINSIIDNKSIFVLNSKEEADKKRFLENLEDYQIIVGGTMLSRGVTFENLIVELILNSPETTCVDVLLQRCRWFGNRKDRMKYINILLTKKLKEALYQSEKYLNIFRPGIFDLRKLRIEISSIDRDLSIYKIRSTNSGKSQ